MNSRYIFYASIILAAYLLFHFLKDDTPATYSWLTEQHIREAATVLEPVLPRLEAYFLNGKKRLPRTLQEVDLGHLENIADNRFVAGLDIQHFVLVVRLKDAETNKRTFFTLSPQRTTNGIRWNCDVGNNNPAFFAESFPDCEPLNATPYGRLMEMVGMDVIVEAEKAIARGADINRIVDGRYPLYLAIKNKSVRMVEFLITAGANVNLGNHDDFGKTPLMYAIGKNDMRIIKILVEHGADVNARDSEGDRILDYVDKNNYDLKDYLVQHGAMVIL